MSLTRGENEKSVRSRDYLHSFCDTNELNKRITCKDVKSRTGSIKTKGGGVTRKGKDFWKEIPFDFTLYVLYLVT